MAGLWMGLASPSRGAALGGPHGWGLEHPALAPWQEGDAGVTQLWAAQGSPCSASRDLLAGVSGSCGGSPKAPRRCARFADGETEAGGGAGGGREGGCRRQVSLRAPR